MPQAARVSEARAEAAGWWCLSVAALCWTSQVAWMSPSWPGKLG